MKKLYLIIFTLIAIFGFGILNVNAETLGDFTYEINGNMVTIVGYSSSGPKKVVIPDTIDGKTVTTIGSSAFNGRHLTSVTFPKGLQTILESAFSSNRLTSVTIPSTVETIGNYAFDKNQLTSVTFSEGIETIGNGAFRFNQLTSLTIPSSVKTIGYYAFTYQLVLGNPTLNKVVILGKTTAIGNNNYDVFLDSTTDDFKMYGYAGSTGETYANATGGSENKVAYDFETLKELKTDMIAEIPTQYFTGTVLKPVVTITDGDTTLTKDVDYTVTYSNNNTVGTGKVTITGIGAYEYATATKIFTIAKKQYSVIINPITGATITPGSTIKVDYDGSQNYTIAAENGYKITSILVNGEEKLSTLSNDILTIKNPTKNTTITVITETISYSFTEGKDAEYSGRYLTFKLDGLLELLDKVYVNGELLSADNYTTKSGSTIITLKDEYLKTLDAGTYDLKVTYTNGAEDTTTFKINEKTTDKVIDEAKEENPKTADKVIDEVKEQNPKTSDGVLLYVGLGLVSLLGLTGTGLYIKKRFN